MSESEEIAREIMSRGGMLYASGLAFVSKEDFEYQLGRCAGLIDAELHREYERGYKDGVNSVADWHIKELEGARQEGHFQGFRMATASFKKELAQEKAKSYQQGVIDTVEKIKDYTIDEIGFEFKHQETEFIIQCEKLKQAAEKALSEERE